MTDHEPEIQLDGKAIGAFLRSKRKELGMTQQEVASVCSISLDTYKKWEQGARIPLLADVVKLAQFYHVSIETILQLDTASCQSDSQDQSEKSKIINEYVHTAAASDLSRSEELLDINNLSAHSDSSESEFLPCRDDSDCSTYNYETGCETHSKKRAVKSGQILLVAGLMTMLIILTVFIITMIRLQNMARKDYQNTVIETFIEQRKLKPDETIYTEAQ